MKRDLDEIEMELGKESMKYVCPGNKWCNKACGGIFSRLNHSVPHEHTADCDQEGDCPGKCIPVEPEGVKWYYRMSCATRSCAANDEGMCNVSINGLATCSKHQWPKPSPGLLQRMGMAKWEEEEKDWFVVSKNVGIGTATQLLVRRQDAQEVVTIGTSERRMFRWSDGVQG